VGAESKDAKLPGQCPKGNPEPHLVEQVNIFLQNSKKTTNLTSMLQVYEDTMLVK
jgi:hypothetical protein